MQGAARNHQDRAGSNTSVQELLADLKECSRTRNLQKGRQLHADAVDCGHGSSIFVASALINMYAKCRSMAAAQQVFDRMKHPSVVSWNALIMGYAANGQGLTALDWFARTPAPDSVTFVAALKACASLAVEEDDPVVECRNRGRALQCLLIASACDADVKVQNSLMDLYVKCGSMVDARQAFTSMKDANLVSWTTLIMGYAENGEGVTALQLFERMRSGGHSPDAVAFVAALKACTSLAGRAANRSAECRKLGKVVHILAVESCCDCNIFVQNTLIDMYAKCSSMVDARQVFDCVKDADIVSWNALIVGYVENGLAFTALHLFTQLGREQGLAPDSASFVAALKACSCLAGKGANGLVECRSRGKALQDLAVENGCISDMYVQGTLIDMYSKAGSMTDARQVFDGITHPFTVSWNTLITGYAENGQGGIALDLFTRMRTEGPAPDTVTFRAALKACGLIGALETGRRIHAEIERHGDLNVVLVTCLVNFYAKCGSLLEARSVFLSHAGKRDLLTWNAMLAGFSSTGDHKSVFKLFQAMQDAGFQPDAVTFVSILTCCSHAGLVGKGKECFDAMSTRYGVTPSVEHYTCIVDIFGRANKLDQIMAWLETLPRSLDDASRRSISAACSKWRNVEFRRLFE